MVLKGHTFGLKPDKTSLLILLFTIAANVALALYVGFIMGQEIVYTHFFYIPIILAGTWYHKKAIYAALSLSILYILITHLSTQVITIDNFERCAVLIAVAYVIGLISEKRAKAQEATKLAYAELNQIFNTAADGMLVIDKDFNILRINETSRLISGIHKDEAVSKKCYEVFRGSLCRTPGCPLTRILGGEERIEGEVEKERNDGTRIPCILTATSLRGPDGELIGIVEDLKDITERRKAEAKLKQTLAELKRSNAELEQFAYVTSHDLQEPLRMVSSYAQLLERRYKGRLDSDADEFVAYAVDGATRMRNIINDLLDYSRVSTRGKPFEPTNCKAVLDSTLANLRIAIEESGVVVTSDPLPTVMADDVQLVQLFQNLIGNAIKFRSEEPPRVHVSAEQKGNEWVFSVRDNGIGIDPQYAERIFQVFQRLHSRAEYAGTGIGLAISKKIMERHGGPIWVKSQSGEGSTFYFTIPIKE